jgi:ankyrin repeat protein
MITKYNLYNESLRDKLKGKSKEDIMKSLKDIPLREQFYKSCEFGLADVVKELLPQVKIPIWDETGIELASKNGHLDVVKELLNYGIEPVAYHNSPLRNAAEGGHLEIVKLLLKYDEVDPSDYNNGAIKEASEGGYLEIVKLLLNDSRFNFTIENYNDTIKYTTDKNIIELFKKHKPTILNKIKRTIKLNESLRDKLKGKSKEDVMKSLLNTKLSPIDLLYKSVQNDIKDGVILALKKGATTTMIRSVELDYYVEQALMWAVKNEHVDIIQMLIDNGVSVRTNSNKALRTAAYEGYYNVAKILLENGADVHAEDDDSIRWAATNGHHRLVKLLLDYHAYPAIGLSGAIKYNHHNIVRLLKKYIMLRKRT